MRDYANLFADIVKIVREDYAGYADRRQFDISSVYAGILSSAFRRHELDDALFFRVINEYLAEFADRSLRFEAAGTDVFAQTTHGFWVRRYADVLIVTDSGQEQRLKAGDRIVRLNRQDIATLAPGNARWLYGDTPERELWGGLLRMCWSFTVQRADGSVAELETGRYPIQPPVYRNTFRQLAADAACLRLERFADAGEIESLMEEHIEALRGCRRLVLDLRRSRGGTELAWEPLLPLVFPDGLPGAACTGSGLYTNYSAANCTRRIAVFRAMQQGTDPESHQLLGEIIAELEAKQGTGLLFEPEELVPDLPASQGASPEAVVILTDLFCEGVAEAFVQLCRRSPRVTVAGRNTMGCLDYTNLVSVSVDGDFVLTYPISVSKDAREGRGICRRGLAPDRFIPWMPEHLVDDSDLVAALEI